jgi:hypothetical protein
LNTIKKQSKKVAVRVTRQSDASVTAYDNFEQTEGVKKQRLDNQGTFRSVTTGQVFQGLEIPFDDLRQNMLDSYATLSATTIFQASSNQDDAIERQVSQCQGT